MSQTRFRGAYLTVTAQKRDLVRGLIYPVPDPRYPFLGVHLTRRVSGEVEVGPNAVLALRREGYRRRDVRVADVRDIVTGPGLWRMARLAPVPGSVCVRFGREGG